MVFSGKFLRVLVAVAAGGVSLATHGAYPPASPGVSFDAVLSLPAGQPSAVLRYGDAPAQFAELWLPDTAGPAPLVVFIHGGCWLNAYGVDHSRPLATALVEAGYGVLSVEYRRVGDPGGGWPGSLEDIRAALDLIVEPPQPDLDLERVALAGHSAGGHLALLLGDELAEAPRPGLALRGVLGLAPIVDIAEYAAGTGSCNQAAVKFMGGPPSTGDPGYRAANPSLGTPHPGTVILLGRDDAIVPYRLPALGPLTLVGEPAGHFDWIHPGTPAWQRLLRELGYLLR
jgi:acetyl esterase/lipase